MFALTAREVYAPREVIQDGLVLMDAGRIIRVGPARASRLPAGTVTRSLPDSRILPGFIDLHTHGLLGVDGFGAGLEQVIRLLPRYGVTSFLVATVTLPMERVISGLMEMRRVLDAPPPGARCLGIHLEGNFLSPQRTGMANPDWCQPLTRASFEQLQQAAGGWIRMVTFAPEEGEAMEVIPWLVEQGVIPAIGHSNATYEQAVQAVRLGMTHATHTFNAMSPFHHRAPGVVGAVLTSPRVTAELIADGQHVHPAAMQLLLQTKGVDRVCLVSDSSPFAGLADGTYPWEGYTLVIKDGTCRLADGTLAGASCLLDSGFRSLLHLPGIQPAEAARCASEVPAGCLGLPGRKGQILHGCDADLVVMDENWQVEMTLVGGEIVWERGMG